MDLLTSGLVEALAQLGTVPIIIAFLIGTANGLVFGLLPGLSGSIGIALMIPLTYGMSLTEIMVLFTAAMSGQSFSGSITSILMNIPGTAANAATTFDGYPMAKMGRGGYAIGISATASSLGTLIGAVIILFLLPFVRMAVLAFGYAEYALLGMLGITTIAMASRGSMLKGLIAGALGILIACIGYSPIGNQLRFTFGFESLWSGISLLPVLIGMFAVAEIVKLTVANETISARSVERVESQRDVWAGVGYVLKKPGLLLRSSTIGTIIGIIPGVGGTVASFLAYAGAEKTSKNGRFGKGDPRGVLAPEAANDAKDSGSTLPSLGFGIPGSADWAIILGAMILHGINPGPQLMRSEPSLIWIVVIVIVLASFLTSLIGVLGATRLTWVTRVRPSLLGPAVTALAVSGSFALERKSLDVVFAIAAGLLGYWFLKNSVTAVPLVLGFILGKPVESWYLRAVATAENGNMVFFTRPIALVLVLVIVAMVVSEIRNARRGTKKMTHELHDARPAVNGLILFGAIFFVGLFTVLASRSFNAPTDLVPRVLGILLMLGSAFYLAIVLVPALRTRMGAVVGEGSFREKLVIDPTLTLSKQGARTAEGVRATDGALEPEIGATTTVTIADGEGDGESAGAEQDQVDAPVRSSDTGLLRSGSRSRAIVVVLAHVAFAALAWIVGVALASVVFVVLLVRIIGRESWRVSAAVTVGTLGTLYLLFVVILKTPVSFGLLGG